MTYRLVLNLIGNQDLTFIFCRLFSELNSFRYFKSLLWFSINAYSHTLVIYYVCYLKYSINTSKT